MNKTFLSFLTTIITLFVASSVSAQIKYGPTGLLIGNINQQHSHFSITAATNGIYFQNTNGRFLQLDVAPAGSPRIAGHGDQIVFYNTATSKFNAIQVSQVLNYSDANAKTGVRTFKSGIDVIKRLRPVSYNFIDTQRRMTASNKYTGDNAEIGLLAQELEEVLPNLVFTDDEGRKLVDYVSLIPVLIDAIQTLQQEVEYLKSMQHK
ncbi:MAG: tail fiber domain-containing protein [Bacteroidales bacterium]|nr:tail fiber domain-containing protein [Bacteroidales bacterium]